MNDIISANKAIVRDFLETAINQGNFDGAAIHFGPRYVQHNPMIGDGVEGIRKHLSELRRQFPELKAEVKRIAADGDLVVAHVHARRSPADPGLAIVDIFRLEDGKLVEHWEVRQSVPDAAVHGNGMF
ncbi:nuclear transport factor 2 family protein [Bradyrhizobium betae]|uniref:Polyketide cyclase n=1 Tax=Bradyrhizobium betae TaxID=244734 RepID=A0A4Q1VI25_9BRAD|nr:nuclear transport factor 2 family protein [Bradyrhizobium betae]RXT50194.1 polyketide cyclase [Bradyrhizobium betae]